MAGQTMPLIRTTRDGHPFYKIATKVVCEMECLEAWHCLKNIPSGNTKQDKAWSQEFWQSPSHILSPLTVFIPQGSELSLGPLYQTWHLQNCTLPLPISFPASSKISLEDSTSATSPMFWYLQIHQLFFFRIVCYTHHLTYQCYYYSELNPWTDNIYII